MAKEPQNESENLPDEVRWFLRRADGFLDLGMTREAREELERVPVNFRATPACRVERLRLAFAEKDWLGAAEIAGLLRDQFPQEPGFWVELAFAKRRAEGVEVARHILSEALVRFPKIATIPFNLACYECQLGRHDEAMGKLRLAFALDGKFRDAALEDEDLKPLWEKLGA